MASGGKNYFRHYNNALNDTKIQKAIELLGIEGYAFYFILLELLSKECEESYKNPIRIHQQSLKNVWRKQAQSCKKVITKLQESGLFVATFSEHFVDFDIPNLRKYIGYYKKNSAKKGPNERKENEIKLNKTKLNKIKACSVDNKNFEQEIPEPVQRFEASFSQHRDKEFIMLYEKVIERLNSASGKKFSSKNKKYMDAVYKIYTQGYKFEDFCYVIDSQVLKYLGVSGKEHFLNPVNLFGDYFDSYLNQDSKSITTGILND